MTAKSCLFQVSLTVNCYEIILLFMHFDVFLLCNLEKTVFIEESISLYIDPFTPLLL